MNFYENVFSPIDITRDDLELILNDETTSGDFSDKLASKWAELKAGWVEKVSRELESMPSRKMAVIHLNRQEVNRAVAIFEAINRGGVPLSTYDLVVAKSARDQGVKNLSSKIRDLVESNQSVNKDIFDKFGSDFPGVDALWSAKDMNLTVGNEPSNQLKDWFVNVLSLLVYVKKGSEVCTVDHIKKEKILSLSCEEVNGNADKAMKGILRALAFVQLRCGVITSKDVSYKLMIVVLAYHLSSDDVWESKPAINKLEYWYWLSLFGGKYLYRQNERCVEDIVDLGKFISGRGNPFSNITGKILNVQDL